MKKKIVTNEDLLKEIKRLQEEVEKNRTPVPYIVQPPVVIMSFDNHCICHQCYPSPYWPPYVTSVGLGGILVGTGSETSTLGNQQFSLSAQSIS